MHSHRKTAATFLALLVLLYLYGSFYPFRFDVEYAKLRFSAPMDVWVMTGMPLNRVDLLFNVLAFVPVGLLVVILLPGTMKTGLRLAGATLAGGLLSLLIEIGQNAFHERYPSLLDLEANTAGAAVGACLALWVEAKAARLLQRFSAMPFSVAVLVLLWGSMHLAPFLPAGLYTLRASLRDVAEWRWTLDGVAWWAGAWALFAVALRRLAPDRRLFAGAFLVMAVVSMVVRLVIRGQHLSPNEILAFGLVAPAVLWMSPRVALAMTAIGLVANGLAPFQFSTVRGEFGWIPFAAFLDPEPDRVFLVVMEKAYLALGAVWLGTASGLRPVRAGLAVAGLLAAIEALQLYVPGHTPEITDPLMALLAILPVSAQAEGEPLEARGGPLR